MASAAMLDKDVRETWDGRRHGRVESWAVGEIYDGMDLLL